MAPIKEKQKGLQGHIWGLTEALSLNFPGGTEKINEEHADIVSARTHTPRVYAISNVPLNQISR